MSDDRSIEKRHPIRVAARRTGLSRDLLRAWELRYGAVAPGRTSGGQRLYSDADIERLRLLQQALEGGRRISQVARLSSTELEQLVREDGEAAATTRGNGVGAIERAAGYLRASLEAVKAMDALELEALLGRAALTLDAADLIDHVVTPLMVRIGDLWWVERLTPAHERLATAVVRRTLDEIRAALQNAGGPGMVVATPTNQRHEIGAMLAAIAAAAEGWQVTYLGADLPAASIARAVEMTRAQAIALSLIYPVDDPQLADELRALRRLVPDNAAIIVGGQGAGGYRPVLEEIGALWLPDAGALRSTLQLMRNAAGDGAAGSERARPSTRSDDE